MSFGLVEKDASYEHASLNSSTVRGTLSARLIEASNLNGVPVDELIAAAAEIESGDSQDVQFDRVFTVVPGDDVQAAIDDALAVALEKGIPQVVFLGPGEYPETTLTLRAGVTLFGYNAVDTFVATGFANLATLTLTNQNTGSFNSIAIQNVSMQVTAAPQVTSTNDAMELTFLNSRLIIIAAAGLATDSIVRLTVDHSEVGVSGSLGNCFTLSGAGLVTTTVKNSSTLYGAPVFDSDVVAAVIENSYIIQRATIITFASGTSGTGRIHHCLVDNITNGFNTLMSVSGNDVLTITHTVFPVPVAAVANWVSGAGTVTYGHIYSNPGQNMTGGTTAVTLANSPF